MDHAKMMNMMDNSSMMNMHMMCMQMMQGGMMDSGMKMKSDSTDNKGMNHH